MSDKSLMDLKRGITMSNKVRIIKDTKNNSPNNMGFNVSTDNDFVFSSRDIESFRSSGSRLYRSSKTVYRSRREKVLPKCRLYNEGNKKTF